MADVGTADSRFREIPGFSGYRVSETGTVVSFASNWRGYGARIMAQNINSHGYPSVRIKGPDGKRKRMTVHRLVAAAFLPPRPSEAHQIRHLNGKKTDNRASNLKWGTASENARDRVEHGNQFMPPWDDPAFRQKAIAGQRRARAARQNGESNA